MTKDNSLPWYKEGLNFKCTECGKCCTGTTGYIWVSEEEMEKIANFLNITVQLFKRLYTRQKNNRFALVEKKSADYACVFLKNNRCEIYQARPTQCQTFPWWEENLRSQASWQIASQDCEGINEEAPLVPYTTIIEMLKANSES